MKLDTKDLQFESMNPFDGTMAYAQNKRQQVIMTEKWAEKHKEIFFSSMHPGKILVIKITPDVLQEKSPSPLHAKKLEGI